MPRSAGGRIEQPAQRRYHHGNLAEALIAEAAAMAEVGGPDSVVLREVARRVGVSPTAAYRHFDGQEALQHEVKEVALRRLADHMRQVAGREARPGSRRDRAVQGLVAIGRGYFEFALEQQGLFRCFCVGLPLPEGMTLDDADAFGVLTQVLDELVAAGAVRPDRRPGLELPVWSAIHGLSILCLDGPLADLPTEAKLGLYQSTADLVLNGIIEAPAL